MGSGFLYLPKPVLPASVRDAAELREKLEGVDPSQVAALTPLDHIESVRESRYRATYEDIVINWKVEPDGALTQIIE